MRNNIRCSNRDVELTERESSGWLNRPSVFSVFVCGGAIKDTSSEESNMRTHGMYRK